jgi:4-alpha-glucanotransferase
MFPDRSSGILLHPTSLPGAFGIGDLGPQSHRWIDWLAGTGCRHWQILPIGPTGYGDSPYQSFSANAGNPNLISPELLVEDGLVPAARLDDRPSFPDDIVDFGAVIPWKQRLLEEAHLNSPDHPLRTDYEGFCAQNSWVGDYALFMALKEAQGARPWWEWPEELRLAEPGAIDRRKHAASVDRHAFTQFLFFRQWGLLRERAGRAGIRIIGDIPIFVALDSVEVWARPDLFELDDRRRPSVVAGVPPDYFSKTGQLWGNPLYAWAAHAADGYSWWIERLRSARRLVDVVRIDHFRGFVDYWEIPAGSPTAETGRWVDGPGRPFFDAVEAALGGLPIIAEDLGELHPAVPALRDELGLPGMKILQFAFDGDPDNAFLPEHYPEHCIAYTGTHDNDTTLGWYRSASNAEQRRARRYLGVSGSQVVDAMIEAVWASRARLAIAPLQDFLGLDTAARMNTPATVRGNWCWRVGPNALTGDLSQRINGLNRRTERA